jgi:hypothetical protein
MGTNIPLTKSNGSRTRLERSIMFDGLDAGGAERRTPREEKLIAPIKMLPIRRGKFAILASVRIRPRITGITEIAHPNTKPLRTSPASMERREMGLDISRS